MIEVVAGVTVVVRDRDRPGHTRPLQRTADSLVGGVNGLPQKHFARGTPMESTRTAVPACSTLCSVVARPSKKPWLVTEVSERSSTGVSPAT